MRLRSKVFILIAVVGSTFVVISPVGIMVAGAFVHSTRQPILTPEEVSDQELIERTNALPEVKAFLTRYPTSDIFVERGYFRVDYQITYKDLTGEPADRESEPEYVQPYISLKVWYDTGGHPTDEMRLMCTTDEHGQIRFQLGNEQELIEQLEKDSCKIV